MGESPARDENSDPELEAIVAAVARSRKYCAVCPDTIRRIARRELAGRRDARTALKETKRRLHQVYAAYEEPLDYEAAYARLAAAGGAGDEAQVRAVCRDLLARHASTRERWPILDEFYGRIWAITGRPASLLDLGCGLNPLTIPWMNLPPGAQYHAYDIDADRVAFMNRVLLHFRLRIGDCGTPESLSAICNLQFARCAHCQDILGQPPDEPADVALLLKTGPCLDRQEPDGARRVLEHLHTRFVVVSFAVKSLGGHEKGMLAHYQTQFLALANAAGWPVTRLVYATELVFVARKE